ncbi:MAG: SGNH/GDSL hydrolase family protein, partial [Clostridia bacterium]|nr:SGNH/GDSL hydrolase family protein [Clostridia bacterium]
MKKQGFLIGLRNFLCIFAGLLLILFLVDKTMGLFSLEPDTEGYGDGLNPVYMRYEKTPAESLLTVASAKSACREADFDISGYDINPYPIIDDMVSSETTDADTVEIVIFGDSFVWGDATLNRNELFWRQAEQKLRKKGYNCRVIAVGMGGATAYEELSWYKNYLKDHTPDLVVFGYVHNDALIEGDVYGSATDIDYAGQIPFLRPVKALFPHIYAGLAAYFDAKTMYSAKYGDRWNGSDITVLKGDLREYYQKNFADELDA